MAEWYVKDLSKLTNTSVQTLHHYDRIGLLKPSLRLPNGYRLYSEKDLLRLQQIIALKFFGFELSKIKALLSDNEEAFEHFSIQATLLEQKANTLLEASHTLKQILATVKDQQALPWETIIQTIEVYRMTKELEHSWVKDIFTAEELKEYAAFETQWKSKATSEQKAAFEKNWATLVSQMKANLQNDPSSAIGIELGKKCMQIINEIYGKKYAHLRTIKFEKGFAKGKGLDEVGLTPEVVAWMDKAMDAYWRDRIYNILNQVGTGISDKIIFNEWHQVLDEMYGENNERKKEIYDIALQDSKVNLEAKEWLNTLRELAIKNSHLL